MGGRASELRSPVLVCAFAGWNDAAGAATTALTAAAESLDAEVIAQIDPEEFFDFQANRPTISLAEGQTREIEWPGNVLMAAPARRAPSATWCCWRAPSRTCAGARSPRASPRPPSSLGVEMVVTLGRPDRRRRPHPAGADHRPRLRRRAGRAARPRPLELRGPDRRRRRPARRLRRAGASPRRASGPRSPTTSPRSPTRRRPWPCCAGWRAWSESPSRPRRSRRSRSPSSARSRTLSRPTPRSRSWCSGSRSRPSSSTSTRTSPRASPWRRDFEHFLRQQGGGPGRRPRHGPPAPLAAGCLRPRSRGRSA